MTRTVTLRSPFDGSPTLITASSSTQLRKWALGKCFSAFCSNPIYFVRLSEKGNALSGYCWGCAHWRIYEYLAKEISARGAWFLLNKGKLEKFWVDPRALQFTHAPKNKRRNAA